MLFCIACFGDSGNIARLAWLLWEDIDMQLASVRLPLACFSLLATVGMGFGNTVRANILADWTFETSQPTTAGPLAPEVTSGGPTASATAFHSTPPAFYSSPEGNGSGHSWDSFASPTWAVGDYYQFSTTTLGNTDFSVSWDQVSRAASAPFGAGPGEFTLQYNLDGGAFADIMNYTVLPNSGANLWNTSTPVGTTSYTGSVNGISATTITFRLLDRSTVGAGGGTTGLKGDSRVDNFAINGTTAVPETNAFWLGSMIASVVGLVVWTRAAWQKSQVAGAQSREPEQKLLSGQLES
jgi:hypothetical protein